MNRSRADRCDLAFRVLLWLFALLGLCTVVLSEHVSLFIGECVEQAPTSIRTLLNVSDFFSQRGLLNLDRCLWSVHVAVEVSPSQ